MTLFEQAVEADLVNEQRPTPDMIQRKYQQHPGILRKGISSPALLQKEPTAAQDAHKPLHTGTPKFGREKGGFLMSKAK